MQSSVKIKFYWNKLPFKEAIYASFGICGLLILTMLLLQGFLPPQVPLFYGEPVGENQLVSSLGLIIAPVFALIITFINLFIATKISDEFSEKVLVISSLFISILALITSLRIIFLVAVF